MTTTAKIIAGGLRIKNKLTIEEKMRTIDVRHLDVPTEELLEYITAHIKTNIRNDEQQIIVTPSQLENIKYRFSTTRSSMGYICTFMGIPVIVGYREQDLLGKPFPEPIIDESEDAVKMFREAIASSEERIRGEYAEEKPKSKVSKKETKQQGRPRHMPVWKD